MKVQLTVTVVVDAEDGTDALRKVEDQFDDEIEVVSIDVDSVEEEQ